MSRLIRAELKTYAASAVTDGGGDASISLPAGYFSAILQVFVTAQRATTTDTEYAGAYVRSSSTSSVTARLYESKSTSTIPPTVAEGLETGPAGVVIHMLVVGV